MNLFFRCMTEVVDIDNIQGHLEIFTSPGPVLKCLHLRGSGLASYGGLTILLLVFQRSEGDLMTDSFSVL